MMVSSLVVYYTRTGSTRFAAEAIAAELGSDIEEIIDLKNREGRLGFMGAGKAGMTGKGTEIAPTKRVLSDYDLIIIGSPIWAWGPTPAVRTYIKKNDLSGKKVAFFLTNDGSLRQAVEKTKALLSNATIVGELILTRALANKEETQNKITEWCNTLKAQ
jgi:flavodoxin